MIAMFRLHIKCENAAFTDEGQPSVEARGREVAAILRNLADDMEEGLVRGFLVDTNGNAVGFAEFKEE